MFLATTLLLVLWWLWAIEYRRYRVLVLKDALFKARDELFAAAVRGKLSFDDPAYRMTRILLNGMLRQAEDFSLPHFFGMTLTRFWWSDRKIERRFNDQFVRVRAHLTESGKAAVQVAIDQAHVAIVAHVLHISFVFGPALQTWKLWHRWREAVASRRSSVDLTAFIVSSGGARGPMQQSLDTLDASAHLVGDLEAKPLLVHAI